MPNVFKNTLQISLKFRLTLNCTLCFLGTYSKAPTFSGRAVSIMSIHERSTQKHSTHYLQNRAYSKKHSTYCIKAFKSSKNILKSFQKHEKALVKHSINLLLSMFVSLFRSIRLNYIPII